MIDAAQLDQLTDDLKRDAARVISQAAEQLPNVLKARTPIDTGHLKRSWKSRHWIYAATVRNTAFYAGYVEHGTSRSRAQPMLAPIIPAIEQEIARAFNTGTDFYLTGGYFTDPVDQLRKGYRQKYSGYGSGRSYSG